MPESMLKGSESPLQDVFDAALVDLDGVAYRGPHAIPTAPPALQDAREAGMGLVFVTNNASREPHEVAEHLSSLGIPTEADEVLTAAQALARLMAADLEPGATVLAVGGKGLRTALVELGFSLVASAQDNPDAVAQGFVPDISWRDLAEAAYAVQGGARYFASNLDLTLPNERGIAPGNGSLVGAVVNATGVAPTAAGKPEPTLFHLAAASVSSERPLAIGDRLDTDLKGARAAGMPGLLVFTGVSAPADAVLAPRDQRPTYVGEDLGCLAQPHPKPRRDGSTWNVGAASASVDAGKLIVKGTGIDAVRAACAASWAAADAGEPVDGGSIPDFGVGS
ncbi:HAD-IIA family hydrolase [Demequina sp. TTPB684]|uniref:HAD-IIA family hydrolase n=1 Tax=unclassified Demequina TaxID=2620311 RepID=UPI001CF477FB|nr:MULTISPECIES: HAD-IIA family hydrolase [unclassified Demequina]MCB2413025.1 HAD-IIA family hydrolase [Demequina sp. TTPB684]UPU89442.1 HAD-IIA family hydrolase [Demequina sp. TMPB413]